MTSKPYQLNEIIRSDFLGYLRQVEAIQPLVATVAQFNVVVDANIILGDLIWLVTKRKKPDSMTNLMECISAGTITAYIPRSVLNEVIEHIPTIAKKRGIDEAALQTAWRSYRRMLKIRTPRKAVVNKYTRRRDPDDAPILALADMIKADGIFSKDFDIIAMGGLVIELNFLEKARDYSRKTAVSVTVQAAGCTAFTITSIAFLELIKGIQNLAKKIPFQIFMIIFVASLLLFSHHRSREYICNQLRPLMSMLESYWPIAYEFLISLALTVIENTESPPEIAYRPSHPIQNSR